MKACLRLRPESSISGDMVLTQCAGLVKIQYGASTDDLIVDPKDLLAAAEAMMVLAREDETRNLWREIS